VYAYGTMKRMPGDDTWAALEATAVRMAPGMKAQEAANLTWAYAQHQEHKSSGRHFQEEGIIP